MRERYSKYSIRKELRKIAYMLCLVITVLMADVVVARATDTAADEAAA
jgi:hypothetical protein